MGGHANPRPVSGEIMTAPGVSARSAPRSERTDVVDAEYVTLHLAERAHVPHEAGHPTRAGVPALAGIGVLSREGARLQARGPARGGPAFWLFGSLAAAGAFWVSGGYAVLDNASARRLGTTGEPLQIAAIRSRLETLDGRAVLFVEGRIANEGSKESAVPPLAIEVAARGGGVARYNLGTSGGRIAPGGSFAFSSRFEAPKEGVETVSVSFREN